MSSMNNQSGRESVSAPSRPVQQMPQVGTSTIPILPDKTQNAGGLKRSCVFLGDFDRACLDRICAAMDLPSRALAVRYAVRNLDQRLRENPPRTPLEMALLLGGKEAKGESHDRN